MAVREPSCIFEIQMSDCMQVFHWLWVTAVVNARFRVSISAYAIDGTYIASPQLILILTSP